MINIFKIRKEIFPKADTFTQHSLFWILFEKVDRQRNIDGKHIKGKYHSVSFALNLLLSLTFSTTRRAASAELSCPIYIELCGLSVLGFACNFSGVLAQFLVFACTILDFSLEILKNYFEISGQLRNDSQPFFLCWNQKLSEVKALSFTTILPKYRQKRVCVCVAKSCFFLKTCFLVLIFFRVGASRPAIFPAPHCYYLLIVVWHKSNGG